MKLKTQFAKYTILATAAVTSAAGMGATQAGAAACDKVAAPLGSDAYPGTEAAPYATVEQLANSLHAGQAGCLRSGTYQGDVTIDRGGTGGAPTVVTSYPGERATVVGRLRVTDGADNVVIQSLNLNGRNQDNLPSPSVYGDGVVFRDNDVTNDHTTICFILGSDQFGRARGTLIERNRIHNCGEMPPTNHHHGIYVEASDGARIVENWIYDNADRGVQLFPDAQGTYVARNVIDGNGQGVIFSRSSANNVVENNVISNPALRYNIEDWELNGGGNVARRNCLWSDRLKGGGVQPGIAVSVVDNLVTDPGYVDRAGKDFRLKPGNPCLNFATTLNPQQATKDKRRARPVRLRANARRVWPGGRLRVRAKIRSVAARASASKHAVLKARVGGKWRRVGRMRLHNGRYLVSPHFGKVSKRAARRFGNARVHRHKRLQLRAYVPGVGRSNVLHVRIGK